jgi:DHA1 family bicyclomycin/chloramphenicol resistance-like MFS transporter
MSMIYTFVTGAPYVAVDVLGISPARLGLLLFFPAFASFAGFLVAARVVNRVGSLRLMQTGALLAFTGAATMAVLALAGVWHPLALFLPGMLIGFANALATPSSTTAAITRHPAIAGAASGLLGFVHLVIAAGATQLVAFFANHSPVPLAATLMGLCLVALLMLRSIARMAAQSGP